MTDDYATIHTYEIDADRWIQVQITRRWPKYIASWSIRRKVGEADYPLASGEVERMPPRREADLDTEMDALRDEARSQAMAAIPPDKASMDERRGLIGRLFRR